MWKYSWMAKPYYRGITKEDLRQLKILSLANSEYFKDLRYKMDYTSYEIFAHDHGFPRAQYWRIECGKANITMKTLVRLLNIHKIALSQYYKDIIPYVKRFEKLDSN